MGNESDLEEAAHRVAAGETEAFRVIVEHTIDSLLRLATRLMSNPTDAEDVVQEGFVRAYRALLDGKFDGRSSVRTWLYRIVSNLSIDRLRRPRREQPMTDAVLETTAYSGGSAELRVALRELEELMGELGAEQRVALSLSVLEGLSNAEIASVLECSEGAVEQRLVRARAALRRREVLP